MTKKVAYWLNGGCGLELALGVQVSRVGTLGEDSGGLAMVGVGVAVPSPSAAPGMAVGDGDELGGIDDGGELLASGTAVTTAGVRLALGSIDAGVAVASGVTAGVVGAKGVVIVGDGAVGGGAISVAVGTTSCVGTAVGINVGATVGGGTAVGGIGVLVAAGEGSGVGGMVVGVADGSGQMAAKSNGDGGVWPLPHTQPSRSPLRIRCPPAPDCAYCQPPSRQCQ